MKALVGAFNQEKALVGAFSVIVQPVVEPTEHYTALLRISAGTRVAAGHQPGAGDTCNWGAGVMAQSRPAEHPLMVRRKTYPIKSLRNVLL